jgi:hypothetical protein
MSKNKIILTIEGGSLQFICATDPKLEVFVVDYDNISQGAEPVAVFVPDYTFKEGEGHTIFMGSLNPVESEVKDELKRLKV